MFWSSFVGSLVGAAVGFVLLLALFVVYDELERRKSRAQPVQDSERPTLDQILESQLEQHLLENLDSVFPGWSLHSTKVAVTENTNRLRRGVRLRTEAGEIDMLFVDENSDFVVVELKRNKAPDTVVTQIDRYMAWVSRTLAEPNQRVRGVIIARSFDKHIQYALVQRNNIELWAFRWRLDLKVVRDSASLWTSDNEATAGKVQLLGTSQEA